MFDFRRIFSEWRATRLVEYERMGELLDRAFTLRQGDDATTAILKEIQTLVEEMRSTDMTRYAANGISETMLILGDKGKDESRNA